MFAIGSSKIEAFSSLCYYIKSVFWFVFMIPFGKTSFQDEATRKGFPYYLEVLCFMISFRSTLSTISSVAAAGFVSNRLAVSLGFIIHPFYAHSCGFCLWRVISQLQTASLKGKEVWGPPSPAIVIADIATFKIQN